MKQKYDMRFLICQIAVAVLGAIGFFAGGRPEGLVVYLPDMVLSIAMIYFNYSLCKWANRWHGFWNERNPGSGEPSRYFQLSGKVGGWFLYLLGLGCAGLAWII